MPPNTVVVSRPSIWGNNHDFRHLGRELAVELYRKEIFTHFHKDFIKQVLKGKNLACWCPLDQPCHADVLLDISNS